MTEREREVIDRRKLLTTDIITAISEANDISHTDDFSDRIR